MSMDLKNKINLILINWDPLDVKDFSVISDEYISYIPKIIKKINHKKDIENCLEDILINDMGLSYNPNNPVHKNELLYITDLIYAIGCSFNTAEKKNEGS